MRKYIINDIDECKKLWKTLIPTKNVSDLWEFRMCFQRHFDNKPYFLVIEDRDGIAGLLPLSYLDDLEMFVFFPGETWKNKTWLERTPVYVKEDSFFQELLQSCPPRTYLRYIDIPTGSVAPELTLDEIGYVIYPPKLNFDTSCFYERFSRKKFKNIMKVVKSFTDAHSTFHLNRLEDYSSLVDMNLQYFGDDSYLFDDRFKRSFNDVIDFLIKKGLLRLTSLEIIDETVAVDLGAVYGRTYTVFLGGTKQEFPGVAKAMNMHHIDFACQEMLSKVDFLCGDFHWKKLWKLDSEELYKFMTPELIFKEVEDKELENDHIPILSEERSIS